jgi:DTW domain-containing protein YfiP
MGHQLSTRYQSNPKRCQHCLMLLPICICALIPRIQTKTRMELIVHVREIRKPTNTGCLAAKCLENSATHVRGSQDQSVPYEQIFDDDYQNFFLFPADHAKVLSPALVAEATKPIRLIVPDGNWGQASRVASRIPENAKYQQVILPPGEPTQYRLRREPRQRPEGLATMEAIARAYAIIESKEVEAELVKIFRIMVDRSLWTKGKLAAEDVFGGLPVKSLVQP